CLVRSGASSAGSLNVRAAGRRPNPRPTRTSYPGRERSSGVTPESTPRSANGRSGSRPRPDGWKRPAPPARARTTVPYGPGKRSRPAWPRCATRSSSPRGERGARLLTGRPAGRSRFPGRTVRAP
ncbi:MAG: hypothetical protein AVDCRST_MAG22-902, partial [uncultured Rubrobacteraceae bacterium]